MLPAHGLDRAAAHAGPRFRRCGDQRPPGMARSPRCGAPAETSDSPATGRTPQLMSVPVEALGAQTRTAQLRRGLLRRGELRRRRGTGRWKRRSWPRAKPSRSSVFPVAWAVPSPRSPVRSAPRSLGWTGASRAPDTPAAAVIDDFVAFDPAADVGAQIKAADRRRRCRGGVRRRGRGDHSRRAGFTCPPRQARGDQRRWSPHGRNRP